MKFKYIIITLFILSLLLIKVYVANELYYTSRNIQKLSIQINALKEERNILKLKIEKLKYKNTIIDPLFEYKPKEIKQSVYEEQQELPKPQTPKEIFKKYKQTSKPKKSNTPKNVSKPKKENSTKELFQNLSNEELY